MKSLFLSISLCFTCFQLLQAQESLSKNGFPLTLSIFSESVSLPDFRGFFDKPNWGVRIGTEFYYHQNKARQWLQTLNLAYYRHDGWQQGIYLSSEIGYRKFFGGLYADATLGLGYLHLIPELKRYEPAGDGYRPAAQRLHKIMPAIGAGLGYQFGELAVFSRYELFGEMPFSYGGAPLLPHKTLHLGARFRPFSK